MAGKPAVVLDNGSGTIKAGFSGNSTPKIISPSIIGRSKDSSKETYIGSSAQSRRGLLSLTHPIEQGTITSFSDLEEIWAHIFTADLKTSPTSHRVFTATPSFTQEAQQKRIAEIFLETFKTPAYSTSWSPVLALHASNRKTGIVWDSGHGTSHVVPVHNSRPLHDLARRYDIAGDDITAYMSQILTQREGSAFLTLNRNERIETAARIKEKVGYVAQDFEYDIQIAHQPERSLDKSFELPDGKVIVVGRERFMAPEGNFQATCLGLSQPGCGVEIFNSVMRTGEGLREEMFGNVVLAGGNTLYPGFSRRLQKELTNTSLKGIEVKIEAPDNRLYSVWVGGSMVAELGSWGEKWISRAEWEEVGSEVVSRKCL